MDLRSHISAPASLIYKLYCEWRRPREKIKTQAIFWSIRIHFVKPNVYENVFNGRSLYPNKITTFDIF